MLHELLLLTKKDLLLVRLGILSALSLSLMRQTKSQPTSIWDEQSANEWTNGSLANRNSRSFMRQTKSQPSSNLRKKFLPVWHQLSQATHDPKSHPRFSFVGKCCFAQGQEKNDLQMKIALGLCYIFRLKSKTFFFCLVILCLEKKTKKGLVSFPLFSFNWGWAAPGPFRSTQPFRLRSAPGARSCPTPIKKKRGKTRPSFLFFPQGTK